MAGAGNRSGKSGSSKAKATERKPLRSTSAKLAAAKPANTNAASKPAMAQGFTKLQWAKTKAKESGKMVYAIPSKGRHDGGYKLSFKKPKRGEYKTIRPTG